MCHSFCVVDMMSYTLLNRELDVYFGWIGAQYYVRGLWYNHILKIIIDNMNNWVLSPMDYSKSWVKGINVR